MITLSDDPAANRRRTLPGMDGGAYGRSGAAAVWTGTALLVWGGDPFRGEDSATTDSWPSLDGALFMPAR